MSLCVHAIRSQGCHDCAQVVDDAAWALGAGKPDSEPYWWIDHPCTSSTYITCVSVCIRYINLIYIYIQSNVHSLCSVRYVALFWSMHVHMESHTSSMLKKHGYQCGTWWRFPNCIDQPRTIWLLLLVNPFSTISGKTFFHCCSLHRWIELASLAHAQIWSPTATQCSVCRISQPCTATCLGGTQAVTSSYVWLKDVRICLPNLSFPFLSLPFSTSRMEWIE